MYLCLFGTGVIGCVAAGNYMSLTAVRRTLFLFVLLVCDCPGAIFKFMHDSACVGAAYM